MNLKERFRQLLEDDRLDMPVPGSGQTARRHRDLAEIAKNDLELGRLVEAHTDALAILHEAGREPKPKALYAVWASEGKQGLRVEGGTLSGCKAFCTGVGLVDCALVTAMEPERRLIEIDLRLNEERIGFDTFQWVTDAFAEAATATVSFHECPVSDADFVGAGSWYLERPGFWHGACGPAACWAGGALRLIDYARGETRLTNLHALAHLGALAANAWQLSALLEKAGEEIDQDFACVTSARSRALSLRHLVEQTCTDTMTRVGRAFGPRPLAFDPVISRLCHDLNLYIRQSHAESDLEELGRLALRAPYGDVRLPG